MYNLTSKCYNSLNLKAGKAVNCNLLLGEIENYINGAIIQMRRLNRTRNAIRKKKLKQKLIYLQVDTHFYFICIDKIYKLISALSEELNNDPDIGSIAEQVNKIFNISTVRDDLEHLEQRLLGRFDRKNKPKMKNDLGNFWGENYSFGGITFPTGNKSLNSLKKQYLNLIQLLENKYTNSN